MATPSMTLVDEDVLQRSPSEQGKPVPVDLEAGEWKGKGETDTGGTTLRDDTSPPAPLAVTLSDEDPDRKSEASLSAPS